MLLFLVSLIVVVGIALGLAAAAKRDHRMPLAVCLVLIILGGLLLLVPTLFGFVLQALGRLPLIEDERVACWVAGGIMCLLGIVGSLFSRRADSGPPKQDG